ncbi:ABC transporter permease subunit [Georgenia sp. MJ173]|uniref:ABC transporter permease subunit n=1 Tax=Georgenia sunbinii TaxID=3117728 RepID=UPI002F2668EC
MTRLLRVELRRLVSRRLVVLTMLGTLAASLLLLWGVWQTSQPMSGEELEYAEQAYQEQLAHWEEHGEEDIALCLEDEAAEAERLGEAVDWGCEGITAPEREWFINTAPPLQDSLPGYLGMHAYLLVFAALLIGATFSAAELSTGAMSTWLSFEPRRLRVYASKMLAAALGMIPVALLAVGVVVAGSALIADHVGLAHAMTGEDWQDTAWMSLRVVGVVALAALVGGAFGFLLRHTAAILGLGVAYLVGEQIVTGLVPATAPWVLSTNVNGWVQHGTSYYLEECTTDATGTMCEYTEQTLSFGHSAGFLLVLTAVVVVVSALVFRRRDAA